MRWIGWTIGRLLFVLALLVGTLLIFSLPAMVTFGNWTPQGIPLTASWTPGKWLAAVWLHLSHPTWAVRLTTGWAPTMLTTLHLIAWALAASCAAGVLAGWTLSRYAPRWARAPVHGAASLLQSLPDLVIATGLNLGLVLCGRALGKSWTAPDLVFWQRFLAPVLAMTLTAAPYLARVTAGAIDDVSTQDYVRTARAKGLSPWRVAWGHVGKNVLIQIWTTLPVVVGLVISEVAIAEYIMDIRGAGWTLIIALTNPAWFGNRAVILTYLFPFVMLYAIFATVSDAAMRTLDPRLKHVSAAPWTAPPFRLHWHPVFRRFRLGISPLKRQLRDWLCQVPERVRQAMCALRDPVLLVGVITVGALIVLAIWAPALAPYDPNRRFTTYQAADGQVWSPPYGPNPMHLLGVDDLGRDLFSRLLFGTRYALLFAGAVVPVKFLLALGLGWLSAARGGVWNRLVEWMTILFTAIPQILLPLMLLQICNTALAGNPAGAVAAAVLVVALPGMPRLAGSFRQQFQRVLTQPFVEGAVAAGATPGRILCRHVLPQLSSQLISMVIMEIPITMTVTATLAFFHVAIGGWIPIRDGTGGLAGGVPVVAEWGSMIENPLFLMFSGKWWLWAPFMALFAAVSAFTLLGEGLRRARRT